MDWKLARTYRLYQKMMQYPALIEEMRRIFLTALGTRGTITIDGIETEAQELLQEAGMGASTDSLTSTRDILIDYHFANEFNDDEIDNHIHLARKHERFQNLQKVVNTEGVTPRGIRDALREFCDIPQGEMFIPPSDAEGVRVALIDQFVSGQLPFVSVAKEHITIRDIHEMLGRSIWSSRHRGRIGGKAAGMLLAYKILLPRLMPHDPELEQAVRIPESYYFDSGILEEFIHHNNLYWLHSLKYKDPDSLEHEYRKVGEVFGKAEYPTEVVAKFRAFLQEVGDSPLILRSSSLLEDSVGYAFSGKYESVFLANQGDLDTRLGRFVQGMKRVHMSTLAPAPILYRRDHNLLDFDEQMSVLVQKVVGQRIGNLFMPFAAGVAFSYNPYHWTARIRKEDGLVRLVLGLGTRAVERVSRDYPRMVPLSHPMLRPEVTPEQIQKYSQKLVDALNLESAQVESRSYREILEQIPQKDVHLAVSVLREGHLGAPPFPAYPMDLAQTCLTFDNFLSKTPFASLMRKILKRLEEAYRHPVDVEFAWDGGKLYLLQCRTLPVREEPHHVELPVEIPRDDVLFTNEKGVANSIIRDIEYIVYVDPKAYRLVASVEEKVSLGRVVGKINRILGGKRYALLGPGRWGSNDIHLGIRVTYADINHTLILGEIAFEEEGGTPEVSYGTHFFSDLVEAGIVPIAIYPDQPGTVFDEAFLLGSPNLLGSLLPDLTACVPIIHVIHVPSRTDGRLLQIYQNAQEQKGVGFFARSGAQEGAQS
ncbi:MAG TPA: hypothetical protein DEO88_05820 [Syntrophobacteraceae bacterium]|nr:hypothetical protein [Syntrophobacteraceae bacterium]